MNWLSKTLLVALRLAIGWHFLVEGYEKIHSHDLGPTETSKPWSSAGYLRESTGPFAAYFRAQAGDPDEKALALLTVVPLTEGQDPNAPLHTRMPPALDREWNAYFAKFMASYNITEESDKPMSQLAVVKLEQAKEQTVRWLLTGKKSVKKAFSTGVTEREESTNERLQDYRAALNEIRDAETKRLPKFGRDVEKQQLKAVKADAARLRADLLVDLQAETDTMKEGLRDVLTDEQRKQVKAEEKESTGTSAKGKAEEKETTWFPSDSLGRIDLATRWLLVFVGLGLLFGLFTRTACIAGALFLLMIYLSMPPLPWLPESPRVEGHYLFVNKNLIELLALLALATFPTGRWLGFDGLIHACCMAVCPTCRAANTNCSTASTTNGAAGHHSPIAAESSHGH
jgi:uncharacterized membrane protein YphA (DoxX/SURF4 family)